MTPAEADWVYDVVLTARLKQGAGCDDHGAAALRICECQYGPCGWCGQGRPDRCAHRGGRAPKGRGPETYVIARAGYVLAPVWRAGRACHWTCPGPDLSAAVQPELFTLAGAR